MSRVCLRSSRRIAFAAPTAAIAGSTTSQRFCRGRDGTITHYHGYVLDITERRKTEDALRESEERYRLIAENTADTITVMDLDLRLTYISPSVLKHRGYTAEEAMGQSLEQIITPASLQAVSRLLDEQTALEASGGADPSRSMSIELEEYCKDGSTIWVEAVVSFLKDDALRPTGILAVTRDITKRKRADLRLVESEQKYRIAGGQLPGQHHPLRRRRSHRLRQSRTWTDRGLRLRARVSALTPAEDAACSGVRDLSSEAASR